MYTSSTSSKITIALSRKKREEKYDLSKYQINYNVLCPILISLFRLLLNSPSYITRLYMVRNRHGLHITVLDSNDADENLDMLKKAKFCYDVKKYQGQFQTWKKVQPNDLVNKKNIKKNFG